MSWLSRLMGGGGSSPAPEPVEYKGYRIYPEPRAEGQVFRLAARIEGDVEGETKTHNVIRADTINDRDEAVAASLRKAKQVIDEQGAALFK